MEYFRRMLKSLQYASELEMLGYSCSLPGFESCNKLELIMGIWRSQSNNPQALILIARMCVEFSIQEHNIWTLLLKQMTKYSMVSAHCCRFSYIVHWLCDFIKQQFWNRHGVSSYIQFQQERLTSCF